MEKYIIIQIIIFIIGILMWRYHQKGDVKFIKWKDSDEKVFAISIYISKGYKFAIFSKMSQIDFLEMYKQLESSKGRCKYTYGDITWNFGRIQKKKFLKDTAKYRCHMIERGWKASSELSQKEIEKAYRYVAAHIV